TIGNLWVLVANAGVQNSAVTKFIASTGFGVTAFQMFFFAVFAFAAALAFGLVAHTYPLVDHYRRHDCSHRMSQIGPRSHLPAISRTTRKRALPLIIRSYASAAFSKGKISFMECTSADALNSSVSCESMEAPEYQPFTDRWPTMRRMGSTESGPAAPITMSTPFGATPPRTAAIASAFVTVAITTFAPPSLFNSAAGSNAWLSM